MWYLYMLLCDNKFFYIGITNNLIQRFNKHKNGNTKSAKEFSLIKFVYCEKYNNKFDAAKREKQLKGWSKAKKQMLISERLGINVCTEFAEGLLRR